MEAKGSHHVRCSDERISTVQVSNLHLQFAFLFNVEEVNGDSTRSMRLYSCIRALIHAPPNRLEAAKTPEQLAELIYVD